MIAPGGMETLLTSESLVIRISNYRGIVQLTLQWRLACCSFLQARSPANVLSRPSMSKMTYSMRPRIRSDMLAEVMRLTRKSSNLQLQSSKHLGQDRPVLGPMLVTAFMDYLCYLVRMTEFAVFPKFSEPMHLAWRRHQSLANPILPI